jgi:hypothetical protein
MHVTTIDRIQAAGYPARRPVPATTTVGTAHVGRHRKGGVRMFSVRRLRYTARHLATRARRA